MRQFRLNKTKKKLLISSYVAIAMVFLGVGAYAIINMSNTNAEEPESLYGLDDEEWDFGVITEDGYHGEGASESASDDDPFIDPSENFAYAYNPTNAVESNPFYQSISRVENQRNESLCWAYAYTTTIENYFHSEWNTDVELSPKHLDYLLSNNFSDRNSANPNPYWQYIYNGKSSQRAISGPANYQLATMISTGKNSLVKDETFWNKIKGVNNTSSFNGIDSYSQYLESYASGYRGKIASETVLNGENEYTLAEYAVTSNYMYYGEDLPTGGSAIQASLPENVRDYFRYRRKNLIMNFKKQIDFHGAVAIGIHYNKKRCGYTDDDGNFTIIDRTTRTNKNVCGLSTGHAVTLVGWDDGWTYYDQADGKWKQGAFIIQNSYGQPVGKEYLAYDSAITTFFTLETAWPDDQAWWSHDHVYDYTDYKGHYEKDATRAENYQLVYQSATNNIVPANNELIFEFETKNGGTERIEWISFSQRFRMYNAKFMAFISTDDGETWRYLDWANFEYPGAKIMSDDEIYVTGKFAIKIYYGAATCEQVPANNDFGWESVCSNTEEGDYTGSALYDKEKIYDLISVYTTDVNDDSGDTATITFTNSVCSYNSSSHSYYGCAKLYHDGVEIPIRTKYTDPYYSIEVPKGTSFDVNYDTSTITFTYPNGTTTSISATSTTPESEYYKYSVILSYGSSREIQRDTKFSILQKQVRKTFNVIFQVRYENDTGGYTEILYRDKNLIYGAMPVYNGEEPTIESDEEGITYKFVGWDKEIVPVTANAVYTAKFDKIYPDGHTEPADLDNYGKEEQQDGSGVDKPDSNLGPSIPNTQQASQSGGKVANTGYGPIEESFINADIFFTAMSISTAGFIIYIIKNRRHLKIRTT